MNNDPIIGIVGGVGPYAGLDLTRKIFDQTKANSDREHLSIALLSVPQEIGDRTSFLLGRTNVNPAYAIYRIIKKLEEIGARVVGIPCNTVHAPRIFGIILEELKKANSRVKLIHMINEASKFIHENYPQITKVGVLGTIGTYKAKVYANILERDGINIILPDKVFQEMVHKAIYDPIYGIKAQSNPVTETAKQRLLEAIHYFQKQGVEAIILGCTEIPLAIADNTIGKTLIIDPTLILARALIREVNPDKLKPMINV